VSGKPSRENMPELIETISAIIELFCSWRLYLCVAVGVGGAIILHRVFPDVWRVWFVSVPFVIATLVAGWRWQRAADNKSVFGHK
jgi:hypothetical protein